MSIVKFFLSLVGKFLRNILWFPLPHKIYRHLGFMGSYKVKTNTNMITLNNFRDEISNDIYFSGIYGNYEGHSIRVWEKLCSLAEKSYVFDIGAHNGVYSIVAANANSEIEIQSFEPHHTSFKRMKKNVAINNFKNINLHNFAAGEEDGEILFYNNIGDNPSGLSSINHIFIDPNASTKKFPVKNLNSLNQTLFKNFRISVIKIDIERAEFPLLNSIIDRIIKDRTSVLCEILDIEMYEKFGNLFHSNIFYTFLIDDKNKSIKKVKSLSGLNFSSMLGRNVLFTPSDKSLVDALKRI